MTPTTLEEANQLVLGKIGAQSESLILGFLPLSLAEEEAVLKLARHAFSQSFSSAEMLLRTAPAAIAYALAVAPGRTLTSGGNFWPSLKTDLSLEVSAPGRADLSAIFRRTCRVLRLMDGTIEEAGWVHAAPFIYQAGILHYWKDALASALRCTLKELPPPDLEDPTALQRFSRELCEHVHNQPTLSKLLETDVGPLLVKRLVAAYAGQRWDVLPPHLREPIRDAFGTGPRGAVLRSPYLAFNSGYHELEIVLPAVPGRFASAETYWLVNGRQYPARQEWEIPCAEIPDAEVKIELRQLYGQYRAQTFSVTTTLGESVPFRLFKKDSGRERRVSLSTGIDLVPGTYLAVMDKDVLTNDEAYVVEAGAFRELEFELRPGDDPVILKRGGDCWALRPELQPGIYTDRDRAKVAVLADGECLHYGDDLGLVAYFPATGGVVPETKLTITCQEQALTRVHRYPSQSATQAGYRFETELKAALSSTLQGLTPGIYRLTLTLVQETAKIEHSIWYWRGLNLITSVGLDCDVLPWNLRLKECKGLVEREGKLVYPSNYHAPSMVIALSEPNTKLTVCRAGVQVAIKDAGGDWDDDISPSAPTVVQPNDKRLLKFTSGGYQRWEIVSSTRVLAVLDAKKNDFVATLTGLATELGGAGRIQAKGDDGSLIPLLTIVRPLTADLPRFCLDHMAITEIWRFVIPLPLTCEIGLRITDLSLEPSSPSGPIVSVAASENGALVFQDFVLTDSASGEQILLVNVKQKGEAETPGEQLVRVKLTIQIKALRNRLWVLDFFRRPDSKGEWMPLDCAERVGYSGVRIFAWGEEPPDAAAGWWPRLRRAGEKESNPLFIEAVRSMSVEDLKRGLRFCREFLAWKYPTTVWVRQARRFQFTPMHLGQTRFRLDDASASVWWEESVAELATFSASPINPVVRQFLLSAQLNSLRTPRSSLPSPLSVEWNTPIARAMMVPSAIHAKGSIKGYLLPATQGGEVAQDLLVCYKNWQEVAAGREDFRDLQLNRFLSGGGGVSGLFEPAEELDENSPRVEVKALLGPEHLLASVRALNRRCRPLLQASNGDPDQSLAKMTQALEVMSQRVDRVAPVIAQRIGWNAGAAGGQCYWTPPLLENEQAAKAATLIWCVAALSRTTAQDRFTPQEFSTHLQFLLGTGDRPESNLARLLSLGAELFAFYVALFELSAPSKR